LNNVKHKLILYEVNRLTDFNVTNRQELEVRWGDCDAAGIVYHVRYFDWFTDGRVALFKKVNLPYQEFFHKQGIIVVVMEASCRYRRSLFPEERYILNTTFSHLSRTRMIFDYVITRFEDKKVIAEGRTVHAYVDVKGKPFDIKKMHPDLWLKLSELFNREDC